MDKEKRKSDVIAPIRDVPVPPITITQAGVPVNPTLMEADLGPAMGVGPSYLGGLASMTREHVEQLAAHYVEDHPKRAD